MFSHNCCVDQLNLQLLFLIYLAQGELHLTPYAVAEFQIPVQPPCGNQVAGIAALCLSATANRQLLRQVGDDLHRFYAVPAEEFITKARHLSVLKDDAVMLDGYYREGEPLRLGLGLYPGERIRQPVLRAIRDWRPPEQKMDVTASLPVQTVRLDSMSLFDVGQARLKDGSTKVLVDALVNIRAKPGWLILVAGYTDATGDEKSNQQLSLRRAEAVRNWMLQTSDIPATCFAVQGQKLMKRHLNTSYRLVWNHITGTLVVASELARSRGKRAGVAVALSLAAVTSVPALAADKVVQAGETVNDGTLTNHDNQIVLGTANGMTISTGLEYGPDNEANTGGQWIQNGGIANNTSISAVYAGYAGCMGH